MKTIITIIIILTILLCGCTVVVDTNNTDKDNEIHKIIEEGQLKMTYPIGVDPDTLHYRSYRYEDTELILDLSFSSELINDYTLKNFQESFNYYNIWVNFPEEQTENTDVYYSNWNPIEEITLTSYENNILSGNIALHIDEITAEKWDNEDEECITDDMMGICYENKDANINYTLTFSLEIEK